MTISSGGFAKAAEWYDPRTWSIFGGKPSTPAAPAAAAATPPVPYVPTPEQTQAYQRSQQEQTELGQQLQARRAAGQPVDDLLQRMGQLSRSYSTAAAALRGRPVKPQRTPAQMANMAENYRMNNLPVPQEFQAPQVPLPSNNQNQLTAGVPMHPPVAAKPTSVPKPVKVATWFGVVKQAIAPSMDELNATSQSLKSRLEGITNDRVAGNAEMNARLDQANKALDSTSESPVIGPDTSYVRGAGQAALFENQHNVPPPPLTYGQLERQADVAGAGSGRLTEAGNLGLTMPGRGERINPVEEKSKDPRVEGARIVEALKASQRMGLPFTVEHFLQGYVNPETVLHEDAKRGIPVRKAPSMALPYANIPFAGR